MKIKGQWQRSLSWTPQQTIRIIDQRQLPFSLQWVELVDLEGCAIAITEMWCRGAPLLAAVGAYGLAFGLRDGMDLETAYATLLATRPTAVNLRWALDRVRQAVTALPKAAAVTQALAECAAICDEDVLTNQAIGGYGLKIIQAMAHQRPERPVNILTHCNAGWLATIDWGTALAPIYLAHDQGIPVHVWVDETRPRNQGASLTVWELANHGVPHTLIVDNAGGLLMQRGLVDFCIVGADRVTANGDVCNKIGTYLKALAAHDNGVPFYVALPQSTVDMTLSNGSAIPIEERAATEVTHLTGQIAGQVNTLQITLAEQVSNYGFDITPARLVTGYLMEDGLKVKGQSDWPFLP